MNLFVIFKSVQSSKSFAAKFTMIRFKMVGGMNCKNVFLHLSLIDKTLAAKFACHFRFVVPCNMIGQESFVFHCNTAIAAYDFFRFVSILHMLPTIVTARKRFSAKFANGSGRGTFARSRRRHMPLKMSEGGEFFAAAFASKVFAAAEKDCLKVFIRVFPTNVRF